MVRNLVVLEDGTEIFSGSEGSAVMALEVTRSVSNATELQPGAVCADMAQLTLLDMGQLQIGAGDALTLYRVDEAGNRLKRGVFLAQKPERNGNILTVTAYDRLILLDKELTGWLQSLEQWPYSLQSFGEMVCSQCGLELATLEIPNGDFMVEQFSIDGVTGRQLLGWVAEAAGCFCRMGQSGQPELAWYTDAPVQVGPVELAVRLAHGSQGLELTVPQTPAFSDGALILDSSYVQAADDGMGNVTLTVEEGLLQQYHYQGGLALEDHQTAPIEKIQLRQSAQDVGTVWPDVPGGNTLAITGNPLLAAKNAQSLLPVAQTLWERLQGSSYTPCTLELPFTPGIAPGQVLRLYDRTGAQQVVYIMELTESAKGLSIRCTGSARRDSSFAVNNQKWELQGKVLQLRTDVDGLMAQNSQGAQDLARLELRVDTIRGQVQQQTKKGSVLADRMTTLEQTAENVRLRVEKVETDGAAKLKTAMGYTFDDNGLHIQRDGQQMENLLNENGMYVRRGAQTLLQADQQGVVAYDVTVGNYLVMGEHARFEDYGAGRTACFYLGG